MRIREVEIQKRSEGGGKEEEGTYQLYQAVCL